MSKLLETPSTYAADQNPAETIELFLQMQGRSQVFIISAAPTATIAELLVLISTQIKQDTSDHHLTLSDTEETLGKHQSLHAAGVRNHAHLHCHRCTRVAVSIRYNGITKERDFPSATRFRRIHDWATGKHGFALSEIDAGEHVLQVANTGVQPAPTDHLGSVVTSGCAILLDLMPKPRIEG